MKYFTKEWCFGEIDDCKIEALSKSYKKYINNIYEKLPFVLKLLSRNINLHDGRLMKAIFNHEENSLLLEAVCGDLQSKYYFLEIKYYGIYNLKDKVLMSIFKNQEIEILSDEIEFFSDEYFSHKMFFSSMKDIDIRFKDLQIIFRSATSNEYKKCLCLFEVI